MILIYDEKSLTVQFFDLINCNLCRLPSPSELRSEGLCPLTPEEAILMLAALGFNRKTHIYVAGSNLYGGRSRLVALTSLYPKLVTKENLLSPDELKPFANYSSQVCCYCHSCFICVKHLTDLIESLIMGNFVLCVTFCTLLLILNYSIFGINRAWLPAYHSVFFCQQDN